MNCESCSTEDTIPFNKAFNKGWQPRKGKHQVCAGDGRLHHHGRVHTSGGGLKWLCDVCMNLDKKMWADKKKALTAK